MLEGPLRIWRLTPVPSVRALGLVLSVVVIVNGSFQVMVVGRVKAVVLWIWSFCDFDLS